MEILKSITGAQWITIGVSLLTLCGVIYTNITTKKIAKANIEANVTAKARIEWIQNVRKTTASLISIYYSALNEDDTEAVKKNIISAREKIELLILFFGPESKSKSKSESKSESGNDSKTLKIQDTKINSGKNDLIVDFLVDLSNDFAKYLKNTLNGTLTKAEIRKDRALQRMCENVIGIEHQEDVEINGKTYTNTEYEFNETEENEYIDIQKEVEEIKLFNTSLHNKLTNLRDIIRIYCKIEWSIAKEGK